MSGLPLRRGTDSEAEVLLTAALQQLSYDIAHLTETSEKLATGVVNHVLEAGTRLVDSTGAGITLAFQATVGSLLVRNPSTSTITVAAGQGAGVRPSVGPGVHDVEGRTWRIVPINARYCTIYGTAGQRVGYEAYTTRVAPTAGVLGDPVTTGATTLGTNPTAGAEISQTVPTGEAWLLTSVVATLVTSAAVANRSPHLIIDDGANVLANLVPAAAQAASTTVVYAWTVGGFDAGAVRDGVAASGQLPAGLRLQPGYRIRTVTTALDVADDWSAPVLSYQRISL